jgi:hypothetical protein
MGMMKYAAQAALKELNTIVDGHVKFAEEPKSFSELLAYIVYLSRTDRETYACIVKDLLLLERNIGMDEKCDEQIDAIYELTRKERQ